MTHLRELKAGDEVVLYTGRALEIDTVSRVTPQFLIVKWYTGAEMKFKKETGQGVGIWDNKRIFVADSEMKERTACEFMYGKLYEKKLFVPSSNYALIKEVYTFLKDRELIS